MCRRFGARRTDSERTLTGRVRRSSQRFVYEVCPRVRALVALRAVFQRDVIDRQRNGVGEGIQIPTGELGICL